MRVKFKDYSDSFSVLETIVIQVVAIGKRSLCLSIGSHLFSEIGMIRYSLNRQFFFDTMMSTHVSSFLQENEDKTYLNEILLWGCYCQKCNPQTSLELS